MLLLLPLPLLLLPPGLLLCSHARTMASDVGSDNTPALQYACPAIHCWSTSCHHHHPTTTTTTATVPLLATTH
jgi:hypothetical protein